MSKRRLKIRNPRNGQRDHEIACASTIELEQKAKVLREGQSRWQLLSVQQRANCLLDWAQSLEDDHQELLAALCRDTGRYSESQLEIDASIASIQRWANDGPKLLSDSHSKATNIPFVRSKQHYRAYPLVGVISPWNFPLLLSLIDVIPALLAGCSVLVKPSEVTPRFVVPLSESLHSVGVLSQVIGFVQGDGETGRDLIDAVDSICFTGSVSTGKLVGKQASNNFVPAFLELGGKDAAIVCHDADLQRAAKAICWGGMVNAGQSCMSIERVYVEQSVKETFLENLVSEVSKLRFNFPEIEEGNIGPVIADYQAKTIDAHLSDSQSKGARILCGGEVIEQGGGLWCQPTVLTGVDHSMDIMTQETFAAVLPVMEFKTEEEAIDLANDSKFGLSAAVFSSDRKRAESIAMRLDVGAISINDAALTSVVHSAEKQSFNLSGLGGSRMGTASIQRFFRKQALLNNSDISSPWWF